MLFLSKPVVTGIALIVTSLLLPKLTSYFVGYLFRNVGRYVRAKTSARRELIISRARIDQEEWRSRQAGSSLGRSGEDEDWEKVDTVAGNGKPRGGEWEGIIGFFHPFW
jgi:alpha-1,2-mannosyltransferase